jgi:hypothetical protein
MSFTDAQLTDIRRFCGYPAYGSQATANEGYRFMTAYGALEYKMQNLSANEQTVVINIYLTNLYTLETAIVGTGANLDTDSASVWKHNKNEQADREKLFASWRGKLCDFMGVPPGPGLQGASGMRMVV